MRPNDNPKRKETKRVSINEHDMNVSSISDKGTKEPSDNEEDIQDKEVYIPSLTTRRQTLSRKMSQEAFNHLLLPGTKSILYTPSPTPSRRIRSRSVSSRRHSSDGLILPPNILDGQQQHQHHRRHGSPSNYGNNPSSSAHHHRERDSYLETGTSVSERCSNSLASSRESSTSLSQRSSSQPKSQRKISSSSHGQSNGKIPWCACWGNGCI